MPAGLSRIDPMAPLSRKEVRRYEAARISGQKAAEYVASRWDVMKLSLTDERVNERAKREMKRKSRGRSEKALRYLIDKRRTSRAVKMFQRLRSDDVQVSVECQNRLLDLLCFYGLKDDSLIDNWSKEDGEINTKSKIEEKETVDDIERLSERQETTAFLHWQHGNRAASKFYDQMTEKNVETYEIMIASKVRFSLFEEAMDIFRQMRRLSLQPRIATYNSLIRASGASTKNNLDVVTELLSQMSTNEDPIKPDSITLTVIVKAISNAGKQNGNFLLQIWREITEAGVTPTLAAYSALLSFCVRNDQVGIIYTIVDHLERDPSPLQKIVEEDDFDFFGLASPAVLDLQDVSLAERLYALFLRGSPIAFANPSRFLTDLLTVIARFGSASMFLRHYRQCVPSIFIPTEYAYSKFFLSCKHRGESAEAAFLWNHAVHMNVSLTPGLVDQALQAVTSYVPSPLDQSGVFRTTLLILDCMDEMELTPTRNSVGGAIRLYAEVQPFEEVMDFMTKCVAKKWSASYWSLCLLLEECIRRQDVDNMLLVVRILVNDGYEVKQLHQQQLRQQLSLNAREEEELEGLLYMQSKHV
ncbi:small ribosomal subunit protein mS39-like [Corticium candelabrum]|uniref:small ribosomal subunit protein mS39-like n=1 Tax=Corticium candelabrum TaxID=121492 RepID=UPI002E25365E|nr:small ribosomal subunit protein mS39-like [Corticium candelabrum]